MIHDEELKRYDDNKYSGAFGSFLAISLDKMDQLVRHLDTQINILISLSSAVLLFSVTQLAKGMNYFFALLGIFSILAVISGLFAIHPPRRLRKKGQRESLMYPKVVANYSNSQEYLEAVKKVISDPDSVLEQSAIAMYNIAAYYYLPKRRLFKISRNFLFAGIILSSLAYLLVYLKIGAE